MILSVVFIVVAVVNIADAQKEKCAGFCTSSTDCALAADTLQCRCTYFKCKWIEGRCGGGCLTDDQCKNWAKDDSSCICNLGECQPESDMKYPGFKEFLKHVSDLAVVRPKRDARQDVS